MRLKMKKAFLVFSLLLSAISQLAMAVTTETAAEYNNDTKTLTIPAVKLKNFTLTGDEHFYDVKLHFNNSGSFDLISYPRENPAPRPTIEAEYYDRFLKIPSIKIGSDTILYNAILKPNSSWTFSILHYLNQPPISCTKETLTLAKFNQIMPKMNFEQVSNIIGCNYNLLSHGSFVHAYSWLYEDGDQKAKIQVVFSNQNTTSWAFSSSNGEKITCVAPPFLPKQCAGLLN